jgi:hypothetical protein
LARTGRRCGRGRRCGHRRCCGLVFGQTVVTCEGRPAAAGEKATLRRCSRLADQSTPSVADWYAGWKVSRSLTSLLQSIVVAANHRCFRICCLIPWLSRLVSKV